MLEREHYGLLDILRWPDQEVNKAIRYGCERVDLESGGTITAALAEKPFPGDLTQNQAETVKEAAAWCANHMLRQGLDWLRGSTSVSLGQISTGQTNPEEPDYFPLFLLKNLSGAGLVKFFQSSNIEEQREECDPARCWTGTDEEFYTPSLDFLAKSYIAKRGQGSLVSKNKSIDIKPAGGLYDGVNIAISNNWREEWGDFKKWKDKLELAFGKLEAELTEEYHLLKKDLKDHAELEEKWRAKVEEAWEKFARELPKEVVDEVLEEVKPELEKWLLEELKKYKYKGPKGDPGKGDEVPENLKNINNIVTTSSGKLQYKTSPWSTEETILKKDHRISRKVRKEEVTESTSDIPDIGWINKRLRPVMDIREGVWAYFLHQDKTTLKAGVLKITDYYVYSSIFLSDSPSVSGRTFGRGIGFLDTAMEQNTDYYWNWKTQDDPNLPPASNVRVIDVQEEDGVKEFYTFGISYYKSYPTKQWVQLTGKEEWVTIRKKKNTAWINPISNLLKDIGLVADTEIREQELDGDSFNINLKTNYFKLLQQEVKQQKQKLVSQFNTISTLSEELRNLQKQVSNLQKGVKN